MAFYTQFRSNFPKPQKLTVRIAFALLSFSSPLLLYNTSSAQSLTRAKVLTQSQQKQNKTPVNVKTSLNTQCNSLKQCSEINTYLKNYTSQDTKAIRVFRKHLKDPNKQVRIYALTALSAIGTGADEALPDLKALLNTEHDKNILSSVIKAIQSIKAEPATLELTQIFNNEQQDLQVRSLAVEALDMNAANEQQSNQLFPLLFKSLEETSVDKTSLRISVAEALSKINDLPQKALPSLKKALKDPSWH